MRLDEIINRLQQLREHIKGDNPYAYFYTADNEYLAISAVVLDNENDLVFHQRASSAIGRSKNV